MPVWLSDENASLPIHSMQARRNLVVRGRDKSLGLFFHERDWVVDTMVDMSGERVATDSKFVRGRKRNPKAKSAPGGVIVDHEQGG